MKNRGNAITNVAPNCCHTPGFNPIAYGPYKAMVYRKNGFGYISSGNLILDIVHLRVGVHNKNQMPKGTL